MPTTQTPHRTPLKRVSVGSLFRLSRSQAFPDAPHGLGWLEPAMAEFVDETETLQANVEGLKNLSESLETFNESFASWLYVMNMNALTTDWPQAPTGASFMLARRRAEEEALRAMEEMKAQMSAAAAREAELQQAMLADRTAMTEATEADTTAYPGNVSVATSSQTAKSSTGVPKKKVGKPKMTAKEKKDRAMELEKIISCLPLEFRGNDPTLRRNMEAVIEGLLDAPSRSVKITDLIKPPDLNQARVNKCLVALVNRKAVKKDNSTGVLLYHWVGIP